MFSSDDDYLREAYARHIKIISHIVKELKDIHPKIVDDVLRARVGELILKAQG